MAPRLLRLAGAALLVALCLSAADHGAARLVQDKAAPANPAVDSNGVRLSDTHGVRLRANPEPAVQYSLVGAIASEGQWLMRCALRPFELIGLTRPHRRLPRFFEDSRFHAKPHTPFPHTPLPPP
ncbi:MAG TPA: hypothetical protein VE690_22545 [Rhodopila sp.]|nr:hypothetical protein [Rhodopila sp.]